MRAFIFSLDAFVAFTLALVAIYSLIFFSSVPSAYYYLLTQGHYLSRDSLLAVSMTECTDAYGSCKSPGASILDNLVAENNQASWEISQKELITRTIGPMIPQQFGYALEISGDGGDTWGQVYDSGANLATDPHTAKTDHRKLSVATQIITFGYSGKVSKLMNSPYTYYSCRGDGKAEGGMAGGSSGGAGSSNTSFGIITCGTTSISNGDGTFTDKAFGNIYPSGLLDVMGGGDLVPASDVELVKLTVYI